ncbi:MAG: LamG domain-containing protein [Candidatus Thermoplasmatota archaeon]|nr:LamG domain-containing protein [Candidatus Thermoplasmatota archaeon]
MRSTGYLIKCGVCFVALFLITTVYTAKSFGKGSDYEKPFVPPPPADVGTWRIGANWTYYQDFWYNSTTSDDKIYLKERFTYTVKELGYYTYAGTTYYGYNLSLSGSVLGGSGSMSGYSLSVSSGTISGYLFCKVSDLGILADYVHKYIKGTASGIIGVKARLDNTFFYEPVVEDYDFPIAVDDLFFANTTARATGYMWYDAGVVGSGNSSFDDAALLEQQVTVSSSLASITVPAGTFTTYHLTGLINQGAGGTLQHWYNSTVKWYVRERMDDLALISNALLDWDRKLEAYYQPPDPNTISISPSTAWITDDITVSGKFPNFPASKVIIRIPDGAFPVSEWNTTTASDGSYSKIIQVPLASDNTPAATDFSSVGLFAFVESSPTNYTVATITISAEVEKYTIMPGWDTISFALKSWYSRAGDCIDGIRYTHLGRYVTANQQFEIYQKGAEGNNFSIEPGYGYMINSIVASDALWFDGVDDFVNIPDSTSLDIDNAITIECWCYLAGDPNTTTKNDYRIIVSKKGVYGMVLEETREISVHVYNTTGEKYNFLTGYYLPIGESHHLAYTYDSATGEMKFYADGTLYSSTSFTAVALQTNNEPLRISSIRSKTPRTFYGAIDELRIFNRVLSSTELAEDYNAVVPYPARSGAVAWYHFDESRGVTVNDCSDCGNAGTIYGATWIVGIGTTTGRIFEIVGKPVSISVPISSGWNYIGWANSTATTASGLQSKVTGCEAVAKLDNSRGRYTIYSSALFGENFAVVKGKGYFVYTATASTWTGG